MSADPETMLQELGASRRALGQQMLKEHGVGRGPGEYDCGWRLSPPKALVVVWWDPDYTWVVSERRLNGVDVRIAHDFPTLEAAREYAWAHRGGE